MDITIPEEESSDSSGGCEYSDQSQRRHNNYSAKDECGPHLTRCAPRSNLKDSIESTDGASDLDAGDKSSNTEDSDDKRHGKKP